MLGPRGREEGGERREEGGREEHGPREHGPYYPVVDIGICRGPRGTLGQGDSGGGAGGISSIERIRGQGQVGGNCFLCLRCVLDIPLKG